MTLTAPITTELDHDDIEIIDDIQVTERANQAQAPALSTSTTAPRLREPLAPFLVLGVLSWLTIIVTASILAF